ncbi:ABC transporter permease [Aquibacillus kalidii]|uniref:ABC transporter permease n=1 Tax=Aquibacillus kalidii TaxID=2762597 RepID=UPI0016468D6D|nr:ABC transporter permease [Aquibacillus kalidii]
MVNLIINEWVKHFRKAGTYVMIGLILLVVIGVGALEKYEEIKNPTFNPDWKEELQQQIADDKKFLEENKNDNIDSMTERNIAINEYRLENNLPPSPEKNIWSFVYDANMAVELAGLFTIIIAAGIVASEFSGGTIKLLLVRPISRSKILLSKYITVVLYGVFYLAIIYVFSCILGAILFGMPNSDVPHLAYVDGQVVERNMGIYLIGLYLLNSINLLMIATMAFMISAVFRNSSLALGISLFLFFIGSSVTYILSSYFDWVKYILFANTDLSVYTDGGPMVDSMTLGFSITMLIIYFIAFHALAFGIFKKRDVSA